MYRILAIILICFGLCACVPVALVGGATAGGAIIYNKRSIKTMLRDRAIASTADEKIKNNPQLHGKAFISVAAYNGIVLMVGVAQTQAEKDLAQQIVSALPNVRRIYNEVRIGKRADHRTRAYSGIITGQVKAALLTTPGVRSNQIKVVTNNRVVYLMGIVTRSQGHKAAQATRQVSGVRKVVKVFEYED